MKKKKLGKKWYKKWWGILILILIFLIISFIIASGIYVVNRIQKIQKGEIPLVEEDKEEYYKQRQKIAEGVGNYTLGSEDPEITIVEWSDFKCGASKRAYEVNQAIIQTYPNKIKLIHRDLPVITANSKTYALAAQCAGQQDKKKFWQMAELLFKHQEELQPSHLISFAKQINLNENKFEECVNSPGYGIEKKIEKDVADANKLNIQATPSYIIEGYKLQGKISYQGFVSLIDNLLK